MKKISVILLLMISMSAVSQSKQRTIEYVVVEEAPVYKGCEKEKTNSNKRACSTKLLLKHIDDNFDYAVSTKTNLDAGQYNVYVSFVVNVDGEITEINTKGNDYKPFVNEAIRLVHSVPKYAAPGSQNDKVVNVRFTLPIAFIVEKEEK